MSDRSIGRSFYFFQILLAGITDVPDRPGAVIGDKQRAVLSHGDADRTAPHLAIRRNEARQEVLVLARSMAVFHGNPNDLIA